MATYIPWSLEKEIEEKKPANGKHFTLEELQTFVGYEKNGQRVKGYIEPVYLPDDAIMFVNEEGWLLHLPANVRVLMALGGTYAGDVIILSYDEWNAAENEA